MTIQMTLPRRRFYRLVFALAATYNVAWGLYAAYDPGWLFRLAGMAPMTHPQIFACLGMVIGLYGILYAEIARRPENGWLFAAVALAGKILGPAGMLILVTSGKWPIDAFILCLTNDIIWWVPLGMYLIDAWPGYAATWRANASPIPGHERKRILFRGLPR